MRRLPARRRRAMTSSRKELSGTTIGHAFLPRIHDRLEWDQISRHRNIVTWRTVSAEGITRCCSCLLLLLALEGSSPLRSTGASRAATTDGRADAAISHAPGDAPGGI